MAPINVLVDAPEQLPQIPQQSSARDRLPPSEKVLPDKRKNVAASLLHPPGDVPSVPKTSSLDLPLKAPCVPEGPPPELLDNTESEEVGIPVINVENAAEENDLSVSPQSWKIFSDDGPHCPPSDHLVLLQRLGLVTAVIACFRAALDSLIMASDVGVRFGPNVV
ncbi:hypothetical protein HPB52_021740 [Rhipicephalus sanguineus]|uniref:Uncharacterized protein n=1 Tax=Rhipicephalus sanguineus TaxID=34632 RepID=A0A9D4Q8L6_RHISA|nr:hypothetical protein HPB52_021740 [Rhipicephalus sanguineus]